MPTTLSCLLNVYGAAQQCQTPIVGCERIYVMMTMAYSLLQPDDSQPWHVWKKWFSLGA